jgi:hypothetical protein
MQQIDSVVFIHCCHVESASIRDLLSSEMCVLMRDDISALPTNGMLCNFKSFHDLIFLVRLLRNIMQKAL